MEFPTTSASSVVRPETGVFQRLSATTSRAFSEAEKIAPRWMMDTSLDPALTKSSAMSWALVPAPMITTFLDETLGMSNADVCALEWYAVPLKEDMEGIDGRRGSLPNIPVARTTWRGVNPRKAPFADCAWIRYSLLSLTYWISVTVVLRRVGRFITRAYCSMRLATSEPLR